MHKPSRRSRRAAFTLIEVLLVLAILGLIAAMVVPNLLGQQQRANISATRASISGLEQTLKLYAIDHDGEFPEGNQAAALAVLMEPVDRSGQPMTPYLEKIPVDAWNQPFYYAYPNTKAPRSTKPAIWSSGPNKQNEEGSGDDINNWVETVR